MSDTGQEARQVPLDEQCEATLKHYEHLATVAHEWNNQVPQAIKAWYAAKASVSETEEQGYGIYVASRVSRAPMWKALRESGVPVTATWIDEAGDGETASFAELWMRLHKEIKDSAGLIFYGDVQDAPWKGALVEVGIAIGLGKMIAAIIVGDLEGRTYRPVGSWLEHPAVQRCATVETAVSLFYRSSK